VRSKTMPSNGAPKLLTAVEQIFGLKRSKVLGVIKELTPREMQVADLMAQGVANTQIALKLGISCKTLDIHRQNICKKMGVPPIGVPKVILASQILDLVGTDLERVAAHGA
jgi:DNA-binding NarL/FixJ family response regulator